MLLLEYSPSFCILIIAFSPVILSSFDLASFKMLFPLYFNSYLIPKYPPRGFVVLHLAVFVIFFFIFFVLFCFLYILVKLFILFQLSMSLFHYIFLIIIFSFYVLCASIVIVCNCFYFFNVGAMHFSI